MVNLECRMYEAMYPEPEDIVVVLVKEIQEMGAYVHLLEYNNAQGMIMLSELSRRRIRSVNRLLRIGRQEVVAVVRVDKEKGYIDLSKRRVAPEDLAAMEDKWNKSRTVHSIVRHVAELCNEDMINLYTRWGWPLYAKYGHAYDAFRQAVSNPDILNDPTLEFKEPELSYLLENIKRKLTPQPIRLRADIEVTCFHRDGILAIQKALEKGEQAGTEEIPVRIKLLAPPLYVCTAQVLNKSEGIQVLDNVLEIVKDAILASNGKFSVKVAPRAVSEKDEKLLSTLMEQLESQNKEVAGDEDSEGDE